MDVRHLYPTRTRPTHVDPLPHNKPTIAFLTVCTKNRDPWLADEDVHSLLTSVWRDAPAWLVGRYVVMPDHVHLFAAPGTSELPLGNWVRYWKSQFAKRHGHRYHAWQSDYWDTWLKGPETYDNKWEYVRANPVRQGLVIGVEEWEFQGELNVLSW